MKATEKGTRGRRIGTEIHLTETRGNNNYYTNPCTSKMILSAQDEIQI